jgi:hypothetical protein
MTTTRRLRLTIDFEIEIADKPSPFPPGTFDPPDPEEDERQARLLEAVISNPEVLSNWLLSLVAYKMMDHRRWDWDDLLMGSELVNGEIDWDKTLAPALQSLSQEDQEYFRECLQLSPSYGLSDLIEPFVESFVVREMPPEVVQLGVVKTATP